MRSHSAPGRTGVRSLAILACVGLAMGCPATAAPAVTTRVSVSSTGGDASGPSFRPGMSGDEVLVAFESAAANLVSTGCTTGITQIFLRDLSAVTTTCVSVGPGGVPADSPCSAPAMSADGRYVVFQTQATNLLPMPLPPNTQFQIYRRDRLLDETNLVSVATGGGPADAKCLNPSISSNGRFVGFESVATNLVSSGCTTGIRQIFVRDLVAGATSCVSVGPLGEPGNGASQRPRLSADGSVVTFESSATNLVGSGCTTGIPQIFVRDLAARATTCVSVAPDGTPGNGASGRPALSGDGKFVAFQSVATNLAPECPIPISQIYLRNLPIEATTCLTVGSDGLPGSGPSLQPALSGDGQIIVFESTATNLVPSGCTTGVSQVFVRNRVTGATTCASASGGPSPGVAASPADVPGDGPSTDAALSGNGLVIAFASAATNLVPGDMNGFDDVFAFGPISTAVAISERGGASLRVAPNPFRRETSVWLSLPAETRVAVEVFDLLGRRVRTLSRAFLSAGDHRFAWDGRDQSGSEVAGALYMVRARAGDSSWHQVAVRVK